jgi:hypothetical protein
MRQRYRHRRRGRDHPLGHRLGELGMLRQLQVHHLDVEHRRQSLDVRELQYQLDEVHPDEKEHRHRPDEVHPDEVVPQRDLAKVQTDCFQLGEKPDAEFPYPDLLQMDCFPDVVFPELVMEVSEPAK